MRVRMNHKHKVGASIKAFFMVPRIEKINKHKQINKQVNKD